MTGDTTVSLADYLADAPRNAARRAAQEADWDLKGAEDARQLLYEREVAWKYGALTARAINAYWRVDTLLRGQAQAGSPLSSVPTCLLAAVAAWAEGSGADAVAEEAARRRDAFKAPRARGVRVFARIRPAYDAKQPEVVERAEAAGVVLHDARLSRSNRTLRVRHHYFETDGVFAGAAPVVAAVVDPLLDRFLVRKRDAALLLFGQTGTGKTHTLREALDRLVDRHAGPVEVRFLELSGKKDCRDLLNDGAPVKLLSDADEKIHFVGATVRAATTAAELRGALRGKESITMFINSIDGRAGSFVFEFELKLAPREKATAVSDAVFGGVAFAYAECHFKAQAMGGARVLGDGVYLVASGGGSGAVFQVIDTANSTNSKMVTYPGDSGSDTNLYDPYTRIVVD